MVNILPMNQYKSSKIKLLSSTLEICNCWFPGKWNLTEIYNSVFLDVYWFWKDLDSVYGSLMLKFELQRASSFNPPLLGWTIVQF